MDITKMGSSSAEINFPNSEKSIHELIEMQAIQTPNLPAIIFENKAMSYADLNQKANQLANYLLSEGLQPEEPVLVCLDRSFNMVITLLGILKAGGAYVPLDSDYPSDRLSYMVEDIHSPFLITSKEKENLFIAMNQLINKKILVDEEKWKVHSGESPLVQGDNNRLMYIIYTSGSTGEPKGVANTHQALNNRLQWMQNEHVLGTADRVLQKTPYSFDVSVWEIFLPLMTGAAIVLAKPGGHKDPTYLLNLIKEQNVTTIHFVPSMLSVFLEVIPAKQITSLKRVICSGEALTKKIELDFFSKYENTNLYNYYGPTEAAIDVSFWKCTGDESERVVPIGYPISNTQLYILNENLAPVVPGESGELYIGGIGLARGYYNREELTRHSFIHHPNKERGRLYKTGDWCKERSDGAIEYIGRKDFQVKVRGFRVELGEIEASLEKRKEIKKCIATPWDQSGEMSIVAYVQFSKGFVLEESELRDYLNTKLPEHMIPSVFIEVESIPLSLNGKVDRKKLPTPYRSNIESVPTNVTEQKVAGIWKQLLYLEAVDMDTPFIKLGGNSLFVARLVGRINGTFNLFLTIKDVFEAKTIRQLSILINEKYQGGKNEELVCKEVQKGEASCLSDAQKRLWFLNKLDGDSPLYNLPHYIEINGFLDTAGLKASLHQTCIENDIFSYRFGDKDGEPYQYKEVIEGITVSEVDLSDYPLELAREQAVNFMKIDAKIPFYIQKERVFRFKLYKLAENTHIFYFNFHHIISDGWSDHVFIQALFRHYQSYIQEKELKEKTKVTYQDYISMQSAHWNQPYMDEQLAFWKKELEKEQPIVNLSAGKQKQSNSMQGEEITFSLPEGIIKELKNYCKHKDVTVYTVFLAIYIIFLHRLSGEHDISVGSPVAGRKQANFEDIIGLFVNTVVIRNEIDNDHSFEQFLKQIKNKAMNVFSNDDVPFEKVVEEVRPNRKLFGSPFFQYMFAFEEMPNTDVTVEDLNLSPIKSVFNGLSKFDLTLFIKKEGAEYLGKWEYRSDLFSEKIMKQYNNIFLQILQSVMENTQIKIKDISIIKEESKRELIVDLNNTKVDFPNCCLHELFEEQVKRTPSATAAIFENEILTYEELDKRANQLAHVLIERGVQPDQPVGLRMDRSLGLVVAMLGILKAGGAYLPIDKEAPVQRVYSLLKSAKSIVCITDEKGLAATNTTFIEYELIDSFSTYKSEKPTVKISPDHLVSVYYTSGSTGAPKGVSSTHRGWVNRMCWMQNKHKLQENEVALQKTTLTFDDSAVEFFWPLMIGGAVAFIPAGAHREPTSIIEYAIRYKVALLQFVPSMLKMVIEEITPLQKEKLSNLRVVVSSGEALKASLVKKFYEKMPGKLFNTWGATEVSIDSTCYDCTPDDEFETDIVSVGRPIDNNRVYVLDHQLNPLPYGVPGDLYIAGIGLARDYLYDPKKTNESFVADPFFEGEKMYRTGDRGYLNEHGEIMFLGRDDNQIKIRGMRVELGEIESSIAALDFIKEAIVTANGQQLSCYYILNVGEDKQAFDIREHLTEHLPSYMIPAYYMKLESFPLNANGKVDRKVLPQPNAEHLMINQDYAIPESEIEKKVADIWSERLGIDSVGLNDHFFELGGHSLLGVQIISQINKAFQISLTVRSLFENPTVKQLSNLIQASTSISELSPIVKVADRQDWHPLTDAQQRIWFLEKLNTDNTSYNLPLILKSTGRFDINRLNDAINKLIIRHESLRTQFLEIDGFPFQKVIPGYEQCVKVIEASEATLQECINLEMKMKFNLEDPPLIRGSVLRCEERDIFVLILHHIICDGWSINVLKNELIQVYMGNEDCFAEEPIQYLDYTYWLSNKQSKIQHQLEYWKKIFNEDIPIIQLPMDHLENNTRYNHTIHKKIDLNKANEIRAFVRSNKVTPFMFFLSAFYVLLSRLSGQKEITLGTPIINRSNTELEKAVGLYLNTLPLKADINEHLSFTEFLMKTKAIVLGAFENQDIPFEQIVEAVQPERNIDRNPLFDILINYRKFEEQKTFSVHGEEIADLEVADITSKFLMTLYIEETADQFKFSIAYQNHLFSVERMEDFFEQYLSLLNTFIANKEQSILQPSLMTGKSKKILPNPEKPLYKKSYPSVTEQVEYWAKNTPEKIAVEEGNKFYSYTQLSNYSNKVSVGLRRCGIKPGDVIAIQGKRSYSMIGTIVGVLKAGATFLNIDNELPAQRVTQMIEQSKAKAIILIDNLGIHQSVFSISTLATYHVDEFVNRLENSRSMKPINHDNAYIFFTSGTTGQPKGILGSHNSLSHFLNWQRNHFSVSNEDRSAQLTHTTFDVYLRDIFLPLTSGSTVCVPVEDEEEDIFHWLNEKKITLLHAVPSITMHWFRSGLKIKLPSLRHIFFAGEPLPDYLVEKWREVTCAQVNNFYGQTETTLAKSSCPIDSALQSNTVMPIGSPISDAQLLIVNKSGDQCGVGEMGEITIRTPYMSKGYINSRDKIFEQHKWSGSSDDVLYRTGDLGRYRPDGLIEILGRKDHQIKIRGVRVDKNEVAAAIVNETQITDCAVIDVNTDDDVHLIAFVVVNKEMFNPNELRIRLREVLTLSMIPNKFISIPEIPVTKNGKVDVSKLMAWSSQQEHITGSYSFQTNMEKDMKRIWDHLLPGKVIRPDDNFFELGGYSLLIVRMIAAVKDEIGKDLSLIDIFKYPTIRSLTAYLSLKSCQSGNKTVAVRKVERIKRTVTYSGKE
ncbi:amino acid adenylation domain-containing protein [Cytobacillus sp. FSL W7-1323]|uniref:non-ribosomal peptide synthetase n=1 Tax=Cytobacillus sp. FSL W7-1323 TaxID=2921700 RepID=UPI0031591374